MILSLDLGTQSFRATVLNQAGCTVFNWSRAIETHREGDIAEQNPNDWRAALVDGLAAVARQPGLTAGIRAVTCCATLSGLVCLDREGRPLRPAILYADRRPACHLAAIESHEEYKASGWRAYSGDFLPQLIWLRNEHAEVYANAHSLLDATGYLNFLLTGEATLDCYTAFTCYASPEARTLPAALFAKMRVHEEKLGRVVDPGELLGTVLPEFGLNGAQVVSVSYDSAAAYLGSRLRQPGDALDISGTVTSIGVLSGTRIVDVARRVFSIPYNAQWLVRGSTAMSGPVLEWAAKTLGFSALDEFAAAAATAPSGANGVVFIPFLAGARSPVWVSSACGVFHGLTAQSSRADTARAVYEGLCYSLRHIVETIEACGAHVGPIQLGGGLSRSAFLNQMKADVLGKRVQPHVDTEVTTLASATIAARVFGWLDQDASFCLAGATLESDGTRHSEYEKSFANYRSLVSRLFLSHTGD